MRLALVFMLLIAGMAALFNATGVTPTAQTAALERSPLAWRRILP